MTKTINLNQIKDVLDKIDIIRTIEEGFILYSKGLVVVPPIGELIFKNPPGEAHIKYGYIKNDDFYVIKIASGFYNNPTLNLPSSQGLMLVFCQKTGTLKGILLDNGYLTNIRTAAAGAVVAKHLAPKSITAVGILGAGIQARLQLLYLKKTIHFKNVFVWTPNNKEQKPFLSVLKNSGLNIEFVDKVPELCSKSNMIITATPSKEPIIHMEDILPGTHITAIGSDTEEKTEIDPQILKNSDIIISDSIEQSKTRGEIFQAIKKKKLKRDRVVELGNIINNHKLSRQNDNQLTIADLTGVAVQDIQIAKAVYQNIIKGEIK